MKQKTLLLLSLFFLFAVVSCGSTKPTVTDSQTTNNTKTITNTVHDTVFKTETDSSAYKALLECRNGKVVIKKVTQSDPGRKLKSPKVQIDNDNQLTVDCEARAEELLASWKATHVEDIHFSTNTITKYINRLTFWQQFQIYGFKILSGLILLLVIGLLIKSRIT